MKRAILALVIPLCIYGIVSGQTITVTGQVIDAETQEPLIGASVKVTDTEGTITDIDGNFSIEVGAEMELTFSYIGYQSQTLDIVGQSNIVVSLVPGVVMLDDIVVIGYGSKDRRDITGSVASISGKDVYQKPYARLENALQGEAAGVQVTQYSGKPGNSLSVRIRGATSLTAGNEPLYVIDGVPVLNADGIDPADVESIDIMKDASASAIYGARAANGVVLITTKRGTPGINKISINASIGASQLSNKLGVLNSADYIDLVNETYVNAGQSPVLDPDDYDEDTDWQDEIYRSGLTNTFQVGASGGNEKSRFFISAGRQYQEGIVRESDFERYNFRINYDATLRSGIDVGTNIGISRLKYNNIPDNSRVNQGGVILGALSTPPIIGVYNEDGTYTTNPLQAWENPVANVEAPSDVSKTTRIVGNVFADFRIIDKLKFKTTFGVETYYNKNDYFLDPFSTQYGRSLEGIGRTGSNTELVWLWENTLSYDLTKGDHNWGFLAGITAQESNYEGTYAQAEGFPNAAITTLNAGSRKIDASSWASQWAIFSYLARASYKYKNKYLADLNFRADGSSRFGEGNRYAYFPSLSLGWRMSEEPFMSDADAVDDLKLRLSAGSTGNQNIGDYTSIGLYSTGSNYNFNGVILPGTRPSTIGNSDLKWETTWQYNFGVDVSLLDYRIGVTADVYYKYTTDLLINVDLPRSTGFESGIQNLGDIQNYGWELSLRTLNIDHRKFKWSSVLNISGNRNKVIDIGGPDRVIFGGEIPESGFSTIVKEGLPLGTFFGYVNQGVNPDNGDLVFQDMNDDGVINDEDRVVIGDANPDVFFGFGNTLTMGGFSLDFLFQATIGNDVFNATRIETEGMFSVKNGSSATLERWQQPGDLTNMPRAVFGDPNQNSRISTRFIEDGSYLRLRNITLSYSVPKETLEKARLQTLTVYFSGQNLLTVTGYKGYDPEVNRDGGSVISQGIDYGTYPQARIFTGGVKLEF